MNIVRLSGRIAYDVVSNLTKNNNRFTKFTLEVTRGKNKSYPRVVLWNNEPPTLMKDQIISIEDGYITTGSYLNSQGVKVYTTEVTCNEVLLGGSPQDMLSGSPQIGEIPTIQQDEENFIDSIPF